MKKKNVLTLYVQCPFCHGEGRLPAKACQCNTCRKVRNELFELENKKTQSMSNKSRHTVQKKK